MFVGMTPVTKAVLLIANLVHMTSVSGSATRAAESRYRCQIPVRVILAPNQIVLPPWNQCHNFEYQDESATAEADVDV